MTGTTTNQSHIVTQKEGEVMYTTLCFYLINRANVLEFIDLQQSISEIMLSYGALEDHLYEPTTINYGYGCDKLVKLLHMDQNENLFVNQTVYRNRSHYEEVNKKALQNNDIKELNKQRHPFKLLSLSFSSV